MSPPRPTLHPAVVRVRADPAALDDRARELDTSARIVELLVGRGVEEPDDQARVLSPTLSQIRPPTGMAGFDSALDLLERARDEGWRVGVFGDYDVDGVTTATILGTYLEALGVNVTVRVARRDRGYGFGVDDARTFVEAGVDLVLTGDCGTSDVPALQHLGEAGVRTVVIDHHQVPQVAPPADAFINPHQPGCAFPFKGLCSAGVAFYLCAGLRRRVARPGVRVPDPRCWLDLVALATVCDMVPLRHENRVLVRYGLGELARRRRPGLRALMRRAGIADDEPLLEDLLGFKLGPRINAPGRFGAADPALRLLRAANPAEADPLAEQVEAFNERRRAEQQRITAEAHTLIEAEPGLAEAPAVVVARTGWLPGVVGIAAAQLAEHYRRPALVLATDGASGEARGSVRSHGGIDVRGALERCAHLLERFGGHPQAAGVSLRADRIDELRGAFAEAVADQASGPGVPGAGTPYDGDLPLSEITELFVSQLEALGPYGVGFRRPRFAVRAAVVERARVLKARHLSLVLRQGQASLEGIGFGLGDADVREGDRVDALLEPRFNRFRGRQRVQLEIEAIWPAGSSDG